MSITASMVKELRERTGAGMMECKKALTAVGGSIEDAITSMRKSGALKAAKRAGKTAAEGIIVVNLGGDNTSGTLVEINCETDFVAKDENLVNFAQVVAEKSADVADVEALRAAQFDAEHTIDVARENLVAKVGENIQVRRMAKLAADGVVVAYTHGAKIGVLVGLDVADEALAKDIAMHVAAINPRALNADAVPAEEITKEREIFSAQAEASGKPADIIAKMVEGRIKKFLKEVSLVDQPFVKDPSQTVGELLKAKGATVTGFVRLEVGEGIEKEKTDFAKEVMEQVEAS